MQILPCLGFTLVTTAHEPSHVPAEMFMQAAEGTAGVASKKALARWCVRQWHLELVVLSFVFGVVLLCVEVVPIRQRVSRGSSTMYAIIERLGFLIESYHLSVKWMRRLWTIGPARLILMSDHPIRELFVRSTSESLTCAILIEKHESYACFAPTCRRLQSRRREHCCNPDQGR